MLVLLADILTEKGTYMSDADTEVNKFSIFILSTSVELIHM